MRNQTKELMHKPEQEENVYEAPAIILELDLETRAGSTITGATDPLDLVGLGGKDQNP